MERERGAHRQWSAMVGSTVTGFLLCSSLLVAGCGGGGGEAPAAVSTSPAGSSAAPPSAVSGSFAFSSDDYGMENATFLCASRSSLGVVLRAAVATSLTDPTFQTVARIDISTPTAVRPGSSYSLAGASQGSAPFPGAVTFFNGHPSTLLQTVGGTITFTSLGSNPGEAIAGSFTAQVQDNHDSSLPKPVYSIAASFSFSAEASGRVSPARPPVPASALPLYNTACASCHSLAGLDTSPGSGPELALDGGQLELLFPADAAGHHGITLAADQIAALKVLLNANEIISER